MSDNVQVGIKLLFPDVPLPERQSEQAAGLDIRAWCDDLVIEPGQRALVPTGFAMELPGGYEAQVRPRSGLALKNGITLLNSPGTIDADYRGEIKVIMINLGLEPFTVKRGMRIAQLVITPVTNPQLVIRDQLSASARGEGGFGHSGT